MRYWFSLCTTTGQLVGTKRCGGAYTSSGGGTIYTLDAAASGFLLEGNVLKSSYGTIDPIDKNMNFNAGDPLKPFGVSFIRGKSALTSACDVLKLAGTRPLSVGDDVYVQAAQKELAKFGRC
jgi:hypothetical protein